MPINITLCHSQCHLEWLYKEWGCALLAQAISLQVVCSLCMGMLNHLTI